MIKRMTAALILLCLFIAIPLAVMGYEKVELGKPFLNLMSMTSRQLEEYKVAIPDIPKIPVFEAPQGILVVVNFLIKVVNGISTLLNVLINVLNVVIQLLEFIFLIVKNLVKYKDSLQPIG